MRTAERRARGGARCCGIAFGIVAVLALPLIAGKLDDLERKLPPPLIPELEFLLDHPEYDFPLPLIVKLDRFTPLPAEERPLKRIHGYVTVRTAAQLYGLLHNPWVEYVTLDTVVRSSGLLDSGAVSSSFLQAIGADEVQDSGVDGTGVGVAVFDSGIADTDLQGRVVHRVDFTSGTAQPPGLTLDGYGHGTHVAGIIGGDGLSSGGLYRGVAPGVNLVSIQVVDADGAGRTSDLIAAIDWAIRNKDAFNLRVANLSLGSAPLDSYQYDPLCQAVESMVEAGIVTVVSAGNMGKTEEHPSVWKSITNPGHSPAVITVGAVNTRNTPDLDDDIATTFSSRGPTYPDELFKPDLSAPGNAIPSVRAVGSWIDGNYPQYQLLNYPAYISLSGSSMAAAFVSGTAALMLDANPDLSPRLVKAILLLTAVKLQQPHLLEQGNGLVNASLSVKLAAAADVWTHSVAAQNVAPYRFMNGKKIWAGGALATGRTLIYSDVVEAAVDSDYWGNGLIWSDRLSWTDGTSWTGSLFQPTGEVWNSGLLWTDAEFWANSTVWDGEAVVSDGLLWTDAVFWTTGFVWAEGSFWVDGYFWADSTSGGDR